MRVSGYTNVGTSTSTFISSSSCSTATYAPPLHHAAGVEAGCCDGAHSHVRSQPCGLTAATCPRRAACPMGDSASGASWAPSLSVWLPPVLLPLLTVWGAPAACSEAPACSSSMATSMWPSLEAIAKAVHPSLPLQSSSAQLPARARTACTTPSRAASISAVPPAVVSRSKEARWESRSSIVDLCPDAEARASAVSPPGASKSTSAPSCIGKAFRTSVPRA